MLAAEPDAGRGRLASLHFLNLPLLICRLMFASICPRRIQGFHLGLMWWAVALWGQILSSDFRGKLAQSEMAK
jgi:hypothetical protein